MTLSVTHNYVSAIADSGDTTLVQPSNWNDAHALSGVLPVANGGTGISSFGAGIATFLGTPSSANLAAALTDETGTGAAVFANTPTFVTPILGTPTSGNLANCTGYPVGSISGTVPATAGGTGQTTYAKGNILASPGSNTLNKLAVGSDGLVLTADAASTNGIKWAAASGGGLTIGTTAIASGTTLKMLYDNAGVLDEANLFVASANSLEQRNSTNAQLFRIFNTYTNASNFEAFSLDWQTLSNTLVLYCDRAGTGGVRTMVVGGHPLLAGGFNTRLRCGSTGEVTINDDKSAGMAFGSGVSVNGWNMDSNGHLIPFPDNSRDIGLISGPYRPRDIYAIGGSGHAIPVTQTTNYTIGAHDYSVIFNGSGSITVTLPTASSFGGRILWLKTIAAQTVVSASSNVIPLVGGSASTAILAATAGKWAMLQSDATNWQIMAGA